MKPFSGLVLIQSTNFFSGSSNLQESCYWWNILALFATVTVKSEKLSFSYFLIKHWNKLLQHNYAAYQSKLCLKNRVKWIKTTQWKLFQSCILYLTAKDPDHWVKMQQDLVFLFLFPFFKCLSVFVFDLLNFSNFSKILLMDSLDILSLGTPWKNYIK